MNPTYDTTAGTVSIPNMDIDHDKFVEALRDALTYSGNDRPALVARIPVICNDIRWIKRGVIGIYVFLGSFLIAVIVALVTHAIK